MNEYIFVVFTSHFTPHISHLTMNIHFSDENLFKNLLESSLATFPVGSVLYGLEHSQSDRDFLHILPSFKKEQESFLKNTHQLQYKKDTENSSENSSETAEDHIFVSLPTFLRNCIVGESTVNFECLHSVAMQESTLSFLYDQRKNFYNYCIMRAYLGFCERDIKHYKKRQTDTDRASGIIHVQRGLLFAQNIFQDNFELVVEDLVDFGTDVRANYKDFERFLPIYLESAKDFRQETLNKAYEQGRLVRYMLPENQQFLDKSVSMFINTDFYQQKYQQITTENQTKIMEIYYNSFENWVDY